MTLLWESPLAASSGCDARDMHETHLPGTGGSDADSTTECKVDG
jgi:hypothetical protein